MSLHPRFWMAALVFMTGLAIADDWPHWRGPARNGHSAESGWLDAWPAEGPKILWKAEVGIGFSSFAVAKGRVYTVGNANTTDTVFCLDADKGHVLWYHPYPADLGEKFYEGGPSATPAVDGDRVYAIGKWGDLFCFDAASGKIQWSKNVAKEADAPIPAWGFGGSPLILGDLLLLNIGEKFYEGGPSATPAVDGDRVYAIGKWGDLFCFDAASGKIQWSKNVAKEADAPIPAWGFGGSPLILGDLLLLNIGEAGCAFEKATGKLIWKSASAECGYTTPLPLPGGEGLVLFSSGKAFIAADAKTGKEAWRMRWLTQYGVNAADPIAADGTVLISSGYGKGAALFRVGKSEPEVVWQNRTLRMQMNPAVLLGGHVYGVDGDAGQKTALKCLDLATGTERWSQPLTGSGAVTEADGKLIVLSGDGELMVGAASPDAFKPTARAKVLGGKCWTVPVLANGRILCRNAEGAVVCVDVKKP